MSLRIPEEDRDDAIKAEMIRLFDESKQSMLVFEKCMVLVQKPML